MSTIKFYNKRTWLNPITSDSTAHIVAFDGKVTDLDTGKKSEFVFLEISDCYHKVRLHKTSDDTYKDFINKLKVLSKEINLFIHHLEKTNK